MMEYCPTKKQNNKKPNDSRYQVIAHDAFLAITFIRFPRNRKIEKPNHLKPNLKAKMTHK